MNAPTARQSAEAEIQKKWKEGGTEADNAAVFAAGNTFASRYPQYVADEANGMVVTQFLFANGLDPRDVKSFVKAFEALAVAGKITLLVNGQQLTGAWLQRAIRENEKLLDPLTKRQTAEQQAHQEAMEQIRNTPNDILKAAIEQQYREENPQMSVFEQHSLNQGVATLKELRPAYVSSESNNSKVVDYIVDNHLPYKPQSFLAAYDYLSSINELEVNRDLVRKGAFSSGSYTDYGTPQTRGGSAVNISGEHR